MILLKIAVIITGFYLGQKIERDFDLMSLMAR